MTTEVSEPRGGKRFLIKQLISSLAKDKRISCAYLLNQSQENVSDNRSGNVTNSNVCIAQSDKGAEVITLSGYTSNSVHTCVSSMYKQCWIRQSNMSLSRDTKGTLSFLLMTAQAWLEDGCCIVLCESMSLSHSGYLSTLVRIQTIWIVIYILARLPFWLSAFVKFARGIHLFKGVISL